MQYPSLPIHDEIVKQCTVWRERLRSQRIREWAWQAVALVHGEFFKAVRPANTVMQVVRFIDPDWLVEVEADAVIDERDNRPHASEPLLYAGGDGGR